MSEEAKYDELKERIRSELDPWVTRIMKTTGKMHPQYQQFRRNILEWGRQFDNALDRWNNVHISLVTARDSMVRAELSRFPRLFSVINVFMYLGLVESYGVALLDLLMLLLIACGKTFHVEQEYHLPRIVHASNLKDLQSPKVTLASKLDFLERNGLKEIPRFIDRNLRNDIAHLNMYIDEKGKIKTKHSKNVDIDEKISTFYEIFSFTMTTLNIDVVMPIRSKERK